MPQTNIALLGGAATYKLFTAMGINGNIASWRNLAANGGIAIGAPQLTISQRLPTNSVRSYKVTAKLVIPYLSALSPGDDEGYVADPKVSYQNLLNIEFVFADKATTANRNDLRNLAKSLLSDDDFLDNVIDNMALSFDATVEAIP